MLLLMVAVVSVQASVLFLVPDFHYLDSLVPDFYLLDSFVLLLALLSVSEPFFDPVATATLSSVDLQFLC